MNSEVPTSSYPQPVDRLLSIGKPLDGEWCDFTSMGITTGNIPDLIRMALDEQLHNARGDSTKVWAPIHAWRALGQLRAVEAIAPLLTLFHRIDKFDDHWVERDLPMALAEIGAPAIGPAATYLADTNHDEWARLGAAQTLGEIGSTHPDLRIECVSKLVAQLEKFSEQSECLNTFLVAPLWDLRAVEAMPVIERAYAAGRVDESVQGDVEDVQIHFGLKTKREHPPKPDSFWDFGKRVARMQDEIDAIELENAALREEVLGSAPEPYIAPPKIGRNDPCPCGSGKKFKKCCGK